MDSRSNHSLLRTRCLRWGTVAAAATFLGGLALFHALRPSPAAAPEDQFAETLLAARADQVTPAQREQLRQQWESFPPDARNRILRTVAAARLEEFRAETAALTPEERSARVRQAVEELRRRRRTLTPAEREQIQQRLHDPRTQEVIRQVMDLYQNQLTARERAELDPLIQEWLAQLEQLGKGR